MTEIVANIRNNTLILYDEPETHLHPNAISQLINTLFNLLERFDSYCIITTHSPIIIRELVSKNVYVFDRNDSFFNVKQLQIETYGRSEEHTSELQSRPHLVCRLLLEKKKKKKK